jgi:hypothetical protein
MHRKGKRITPDNWRSLEIPVQHMQLMPARLGFPAVVDHG